MDKVTLPKKEKDSRRDRSIAKQMSELMEAIVDVGINRSELSRILGYKHHNTLNSYVLQWHRLPKKRLNKIS